PLAGRDLPRRRNEIAIEAAGRRKELTQQARRDGAHWIDRDARRVRRADRVIGDAEQPFLAAAEEGPEDRDLPEHVVEAVERHERSLQVQVVADVIDLPFDRRADDRPAHDTVADRHAAGDFGELAAHFRELHAIAGLPRRAGGDPVEPRLPAHHEIADAQRALLRRLILRGRIESHPHLPAEHARIHVGEAEQRARVVGLEIDDLMAVARAQPQVAVERRIGADLGAHQEIADAAAAAAELEIEAAQGFAVTADDGAELDVEIEIGELALALFGLGAGKRGLYDIAAVENIAAHDHAQHTVVAAIGLERDLVAVGQIERRKIGGDNILGRVEL